MIIHDYPSSIGGIYFCQPQTPRFHRPTVCPRPSPLPPVPVGHRQSWSRQSRQRGAAGPSRSTGRGSTGYPAWETAMGCHGKSWRNGEISSYLMIQYGKWGNAVMSSNCWQEFTERAWSSLKQPGYMDIWWYFFHNVQSVHLGFSRFTKCLIFVMPLIYWRENNET